MNYRNRYTVAHLYRTNTAAAAIRLLVLVLLLCATACSSLQESPKYQFSEGIYNVKLEGERKGKHYVDILEDTLVVYPVRVTEAGIQLDTAATTVIYIAAERVSASRRPYTFSKPSFDIDLLTIPFKFRPATEGIPPQLNTTFQAAMYVGLRRDYFRVRYKRTPIGNYRKSFNHFGFSGGFFTGLGASTINETFTNNSVGYEYEGVVFLNGVAAIVGVNNFTLGLSVGFDHLLDQNRKSWLYQQKPWVGLAFGINLN